jgi:NAD(P)-dependent dehydrogenase (short-subunit alcohol dehydrogenase family)
VTGGDEEAKAAFLSTVPLGRAGDPQEIADAIVFITSPRGRLPDRARDLPRRWDHGCLRVSVTGAGAGSVAERENATPGAGEGR